MGKPGYEFHQIGLIYSIEGLYCLEENQKGALKYDWVDINTVSQIIEYNRREGLDFFGEFENQAYNIEVAYLRGPTFKTQKQVFLSETTEAPIFRLEAKKLINRLKSTCDKKEKQTVKHGGNASNSLIFVLSDLDEMYEPWLNHDEFQGKHPILSFVVSRKIPTIVFSPGTIYEPDASSLDGVFGKLKTFNWLDFSNQKF